MSISATTIETTKADIRERPILFSAQMVRAILDGSKTKTRRIVKPQPSGASLDAALDGKWLGKKFGGLLLPKIMDLSIECRYGASGDRLWVREAWARNQNQLSETRMDTSYVYRADGETRAQDNGTDLPWRPSIHMPRVASRITLEVTDVRVERLQDISQADAMAEGAPPSHQSIDRVSRDLGYVDWTRSWYAQLWDAINGPGSWDANPWVWAISFRRLHASQG